MEIYEDLPAAFFLKEIVSTQVYTVLSPVIAALNKDDATPSSVNAAALEIEEQKLQIGQQTQTTPAEPESGLCQEDLDAIDLGALNDHVYEMFFAQNSVINMDLRFDMIDMVSTADEGKRGDLQNYAAKVEEFLAYTKENPEKVSNALSLLKGTGGA
ncbi:hypothetical protein [Rhizobium sp. MHM7A]|uniref:hypothetical protein n=1 Tax=Rhizobium sp. MHM7A TaxID=2583233 RepID=UPI001105BE39|nr:hypothetical protein [Rhizobium sp. MHM7A]TLX16696.1 hypothetical protein FFR93_04965 [Rhizobium sp. MHM7A]